MTSVAKRPITEKEMHGLLQSGQVGFPPLVFTEVQMNPSSKREDAYADAIVKVSFEGMDLSFLTELQVASTPKLVLAGAVKISRAATVLKMQPLLIIPYLSEDNTKLLQDLKVNCIDLCGNGFIHIAGRLCIARSGKPNRFREAQGNRNVFRGNSSVAARAFLLKSEFASLNDLHAFILAHNSSITLSTVSKVVTSLEQDIVISKVAKRLRLLQPDKLLELLSNHYRAPKAVGYWRGKVGEDPSKFWQKLSEASDTGIAAICHTGRSSTEHYATAAEGNIQSFYIDVAPEKILASCNVSGEETNRFPDLELIQVDETWPFFDMRPTKHGFIASPIEVYLELSNGDKRQQQTAKQLERFIFRDLDYSLENLS